MVTDCPGLLTGQHPISGQPTCCMVVAYTDNTGQALGSSLIDIETKNGMALVVSGLPSLGATVYDRSTCFGIEEQMMNGIHDMGGMHGFGPVEREDHEPVFHQQLTTYH